MLDRVDAMGFSVALTREEVCYIYRRVSICTLVLAGVSVCADALGVSGTSLRQACWYQITNTDTPDALGVICRSYGGRDDREAHATRVCI